MAIAATDTVPLVVWANRQLPDLWRRASELGLMPLNAPRVVIQIGARSRVPSALETAQSLVDFLRVHTPDTMVEVIDWVPGKGTWGGDPICVGRARDAVCVAGVAVPSVEVPRFWFEPHFLITVVAIRRDRGARLAGALDAQADALRWLGNRVLPTDLIYEAHRLGGSDLVIGCADGADQGQGLGRCWLVSPSDIAVERALAVAAGIPELRLPSLHSLARHERLDELSIIDGALPRLYGLAAPAWQARLSTAVWRLSALFSRMVRDARTIRRNAHRIPPALRRRVWRRKVSA